MKLGETIIVVATTILLVATLYIKLVYEKHKHSNWYIIFYQNEAVKPTLNYRDIRLDFGIFFVN